MSTPPGTPASTPASGPLTGVRIVEIAGIGPGPHACTLLADLGADVIRVARPGESLFSGGRYDLLTRGRPSVALDLKHPEAVETVLRLVASADALVEGNRPGVTERLGIGPAECLARNPRLVYGRMTGWGQDGPLAAAAGHDLTYIATAGVLHGLGQATEAPQFPINLLGDFGGGSAYLAIGILAGVIHARATGQGQVVDAAIVDGVTHLSTILAGLSASGMHSERRGTNLLDGGAPFYRLYETADGRHVAVGALEPQFFDLLVTMLGLRESCPGQWDLADWGRMQQLFADTFRSRTMAAWTELFEGTDACVAPVLTPTEARTHPHLTARGTWTEVDGISQPAPAPRFSATPAQLSAPPAPTSGAHTRTALEAWGIDDVDDLIASGAAVQD